MKNKITILFIVLLISLFAPLSSHSQDLIFDVPQQVTVGEPGFFPFSLETNSFFKDGFNDAMELNINVSNFSGGPCNVAAAADFVEISNPTTITGNGDFIVNFNMATNNPSLFGFSFSPLDTPCIFDLLINSPGSSSSSSSSSSGSISTETGNTPNSLTFYATVLSQELTDQLSNEQDNLQCQNSPSGINGVPLQTDSFFDQLFDELLSGDLASQEVVIMGAPVKPVRDIFTFVYPEKNQRELFNYTVDIINMTDMTQIIVTALLPTFVDTSSSSMSRVDLNSLDIDVETKEQSADVVALAAVQHAIVSATMPWQLSPNGGFFITQGGGCVGPFCTIVESGMVVIDPDGACNPDKLNKRKAGYPTVNPSKFFDPFPASAGVIQLPAKSIINPKHPLVSQAVRNNAYFIFQPAPPKTHLIQKLKVRTKDKVDKKGKP